ncbi:class III chitinase [Trametes versicolor FP-101664 SS1]|uniref:class III chitinase n=1 Tax=Trametes versicolor (strain FP-101664) TaxID=717944 RepID=UPI0004621CF2|nr:class III chitinase [Trametes versicolor FP-101664 SS1]EIW64535.1 class III chitinase [Trametes versicolor FP-101664 SS1]
MTWSSCLRASRAFAALAAGLAAAGVVAFDNSRFDNVAIYWGQNSYGATHTDVANFQKPLAFYCQDDSIDVIPIAFINKFFGTGGAPQLDLANICNTTADSVFPGTGLLDCSFMASDIQTCQSKGKVVTLSLGGGGASVGFQSDSQAEAYADTIWNDFLGGSSSTRPFGSAVLDGVDLDIEGGSTTGYAAFVTRLRSHFSGASKQYYITGAPQCVYPDASLGSTINSVAFDAIYVQFYNNPCGLQVFNSASGFNFGIWDIWARTISPNPNVKVYIGAPASTTAAGSGYQDPATLANILKTTRNRFPSFGGVMMWDASQAYQNNRYDVAAKNALVAAGGTGFTFPACTANAFVAGTNYPGSSQVSFNGYIWESKWFSSNQPSADPNGDWMPISACAGNAPSGPSSTTTSGASSPTGGSCAGVAAWNAGSVYTGGQQASFNGHLWTAKWWTEGDTPGGSAGVWTDDGACASAKREALAEATDALAHPRASSRFFRL